MKKTYRIRFRLHSGHFSFVETSGEDLTETQALIRAEDYMEANGRPYESVHEVYEVKD